MIVLQLGLEVVYHRATCSMLISSWSTIRKMGTLHYIQFKLRALGPKM